MSLQQELGGVGRKVQGWRARARLLHWAGLALAVLAACALADVAVRYARTGRVVSWTTLVAVAAAGFWHVRRALSRPMTPEAVAAAVEGAFPSLDNHLINVVLFDRSPRKGVFERAYVRDEAPSWQGLDLRALRNRRAHRRGWSLLAAGVALGLAPWAWTGPAWGNALLRILNPFSGRPASTLAVIVNVDPGNASVLQGAPLAVKCRVKGRRNQPVWIDLWPSDNALETVRLGGLEGRGVEEFTFSIAQAATDSRYRFRAGDAESATFQIKVRPPLTFTQAKVDVTPPAYTRLAGRTYDALREEAVIPQGAEVKLAIRCSYPLREAACSNGAQVVALAASGQKGEWQGAVAVRENERLRVSVTDRDGYAAQLDVPFRPLPDKAPTLRVVAPVQRAVLAPGGVPRIEWEASDDYGLAVVRLERVEAARGGPTGAQVVAEWPATGRLEAAEMWTGTPDLAPGPGPATFRLAAYDAPPGMPPQRGESAPVVFLPSTSAEAMEENRKAGEEAAESLDRMIGLQRRNLDRTVALQSEIETAPPAGWLEGAATQTEIRRIAGVLLGDPRKPLGPLAQTIARLHTAEMVVAVEALRRAGQGAAPEKPKFAAAAADAERAILGALGRAEQAADRVQQHGQITGLAALLEALVSGQEQTLGRTRACVDTSAPVDAKLVDRQDTLASDAAAFVQACRKEAANMGGGDKAFAELIAGIASLCESREVPADMTRAAEKLDGKAPAAAVPFEEKALAALKECQDRFGKWRVEDAGEKLAEMQEAVADADVRMEKLQKIQSKIVEAMRAISQQKDMSREEREQAMQEIEELKSNVKEAALEIAKDLHIFPELPVGNELVEDIFQTFEEVKQVPGSDNAEAQELGLQKEDWILEGLEKAQGRMDDMEMWLAAAPDATQRNTENFDQAELPKIPVLPMPKEMEDIIGDLLKQEEEEKNKADDSATNQGSADLPAGWDVAEGEFANFSAKGKSGNEAPDHKDQDGRSLVGRQGQADGETVAGSGKINEGDNKIEARRTQDSAQAGQVKEDGHGEAKATGGGKSSGYAESAGMPGMGPRRDASMPGSELGMQAMLRRSTEALYAKASLLHVRTGSLGDAVESMRHAEDAQAAGNIRQVREFQQRAIVALKRARAELGSGAEVEALAAEQEAAPVEEQVAGVADEAPAAYRDLVAEYFKSLSRESAE